MNKNIWLRNENIYLHLLHPLLCLGQVGLEKWLLAVAVQGPSSLVLLGHAVIVLLGEVGADVGGQLEQELEPVEHQQRVPRLIRLVLATQHVKEHLVRLILALCNRSLHL